MRGRISGWQRLVSQLVFILYLGVLFYFLFFSERYGRTDVSDEYHYNLVLFREIKRFYRYREILGMKSVMINLAGNVAAFMPFGFFLPVLWPKTGKLLSVAFWSYKVGTFDVDDLFLNTLGGIFGYVLMRLLFAWLRAVRCARRGRRAQG